MTTGIKQQITAFLEGFHDMIEPSLISIFTPSELELLISGLPDIDVDDLRRNTEYRGTSFKCTNKLKCKIGYTVDSKEIQWFWKVVSEFSQEEKALLLQFVTGLCFEVFM